MQEAPAQESVMQAAVSAPDSEQAAPVPEMQAAPAVEEFATDGFA